MRASFLLGAVLVSLTAEAAERDIWKEAKEAGITVTEDRFTGDWTVKMPFLQDGTIDGPSGRSIKASFIGFCLSEMCSVSLSVSSHEWQYLRNKLAYFLLDGEDRVPLPLKDDGKIGDGYVTEHLWITIEAEDLKHFMKAKIAEVRIGADEMTLNPDALRLIKLARGMALAPKDVLKKAIAWTAANKAAADARPAETASNAPADEKAAPAAAAEPDTRPSAPSATAQSAALPPAVVTAPAPAAAPAAPPRPKRHGNAGQDETCNTTDDCAEPFFCKQGGFRSWCETPE
jgi:hypothetical protein